MKILLDMNLSPLWVEYLKEKGIEAVYWRDVGNSDDEDELIFNYAVQNGYIVLTQDLDFSAILARRNAILPSVVQLRIKLSLPRAAAEIVVSQLNKYIKELENGCLISIDTNKVKVRMLPFRDDVYS